MTNQYSKIVTGSPGLETSAAEAEIISRKGITDFTLFVDEPCRVSVNYGDWVYIRGKFAVNVDGGLIQSCRIKEANIPFSWVGVYSGFSEV